MPGPNSQRYLLFLINMLLCMSCLLAQNDSVRYDMGTIRVIRPHPAPYFRVAYHYKVVNTPIPNPGRFRALFSQSSRDTLDRRRLVLVPPEKTDLSLDLSKKVKVIVCKVDTPFYDSIQIYFHLNKQGKITRVFLDEENPYPDSLKFENWKPQLAYGEIMLELNALFGSYMQEQVVFQNAAGPASKLNSKWNPGGYTKRKRRIHVNIEGRGGQGQDVFHQEFDCSAVVYFSSFPQTLEQKTNGIRFVSDDTKVEGVGQKRLSR
jgi:hypothetical protein